MEFLFTCKEYAECRVYDGRELRLPDPKLESGPTNPRPTRESTAAGSTAKPGCSSGSAPEQSITGTRAGDPFAFLIE
jgi:hypothetical protein